MKNEKLWIGLIVVYLRYNQILFKSRQIANELNECDFVWSRKGENKRKRDAFRTRFENEQKCSFRLIVAQYRH